MRFFFDNCISPRFVRALKILAEVQNYELVHLSEKFSRDTLDKEWIQTLAAEGDWVIVSGDPRITRNKGERKAWIESGLTAFFFGDKWASRSYWNQAEDIVRWWPAIVLEARRALQGRGYLIPLKAKEFRIIYEPDQE